VTGAVATDDLVEDWTAVGRRWGRICFRVRRWRRSLNQLGVDDSSGGVADDEATAAAWWRVHPVGDLD